MSRTLLIVDDSAINRRILKAALGRDYDILEAENGEAALCVMRAPGCTLCAVLLDILMPVMDGYEVLRQMREDAALAQLPVVVVTGSSDETARVKALSLGANDFVTKPYNREIIKHCLRNSIAITEAKVIARAAQRDDLTGLYNRKTFFDLVEKTVTQRESGAYVMACFDIDNFKVINDQYGSHKGDEVLRCIAGIFRDGFETQGGICARVTADDFAVLYPRAFMESEEIRTIRRKAQTADGIVPPITFSIGRYIVEDRTLSASAMYDRATLAQVSVKGRYDVHIAQYDETMREKLIHQQRITSEMGGALADGQFEVWFQPQYNHSTGALIGAEALVRWRHPEKGLVPPNDFIPVFERNGFIYEMDKYIWKETCRLLRKWIDEGRKPLPVSVNISRYDVFRDDLIDVITGYIAQYAIPVELLRLEITESAFAKSTEHIVHVVKELVGHGFTVEIDDFGSGYSSLNTLKSVPAQVVKLDMRFLEDDGGSQRGGNILEYIVRMTMWLGMSVIAEGVEETAQADFLKSIGCNYVQGYLYARPMPVGEYEALCRGIGKEERLLRMETVENLDNNSFWNPKSMDTLIFNSYVGGACIFEYYRDKLDLLRVNDKYIREFASGLSIEEIYTRDIADYFGQTGMDAILSNVRRAIETGGESACETCVSGLYGIDKTLYVRSTVRAIARAGERYLVYCTIVNTTAQRVAEQKRLEAAGRLRAIMENIGSAVTAVSIQGDKVRYHFSNNRFYEMLGYTQAQYHEAFPDDFGPISPKDRERVLREVEKTVSTGAASLLEYRDIRLDGQEIWVRQRIVNTRLDGIDEAVILSIMDDISAEKRVALKERRASEQAQAIMDDAGSGITASVIEGDDVRFLFANDRYFQILGFTRAQYETEVANIYDLIYPDDRDAVRDMARDAYAQERSATAEYRVLCRNGQVRWVRVILSSTRFTGVDAPVQLCVFADITAEKQAEQTLRATDEQLLFLNETAHDLLAQPDSDKAIEGTLLKLMRYFDGNRAYVFEFDYDKARAGNSYEVCAAGVVPEKANLQDIPMEIMAFWLRTFEQKNYIDIADVNALDDSRAEERRTLAAQGIHSLIAVPLRRDGALIGFIGIDDPRKHHARVDRLVALGDYIAVMLTRRDLNARIHNEQNRIEEQQNELLDNLPYGAALYAYDGKHLSVAHLNKRYWELVGRDPVDYSDASVLDAVYPDDKAAILRELTDAIRETRDFSCNARILLGNGGYRPFHILGRIVPKENGRYAIYASYSPVSDEAAVKGADGS